MNATTVIRKNDPQKIELGALEFANIVRSGNKPSRFDWPGWVKAILAILIPGIALITYIKNIEGSVTVIDRDIARHEDWITKHTETTTAIRDSIHGLESKQSVMLEKIDRAQKDIELLLQQTAGGK